MEKIFPPYDIMGMLFPAESTMPEAGRIRRSAFVVVETVDEGQLLYNTLTNQMVLLKEGEEGSLDVQKELWHGMFLVAKDADERKNSRQLKLLERTITPLQQGISSYVIFTTTDCNARCFYCYEKNAARVKMSTQTAEKVVQYIISHSPDDKREIKISWFGGEPLYNVNVIDYITRRLTESGMKFRSSMVTNGYLCTPELALRAKEEWHLKGVQITLDGTEEKYNKVKAYLHPETNPYRTVINNIVALAQGGIKVTIRLNIDLYNIEDMFLLVRELSDVLPKDNVGIYSHMLFEFTGVSLKVREDAERAELFRKQMELESLIEECGFHNKQLLDPGFRVTHCMADNDGSLTILPDGHIGKCEHYLNDHFVGHIDQEDFDQEAMNAHKEESPELPECAECALYPKCIRLKICNEGQSCYLEDRQRKLYDLRRKMVNQYRVYKEKHEDKQ